MEKARDFVNKIRDTKGTYHAKMGTIKDRSGMDLTEAEDIKKRWQEYTEEVYKKNLHVTDNHFAFLPFFSFGMVLVPPPVQCYKPQSIVLQALCLSDLIP